MGDEINGALLWSGSRSPSLGFFFWSGLPIGISSLPGNSKQHVRFENAGKKSTHATSIPKCHIRKVRTNLEREAHRAAIRSSSVGLKHHVVVHFQLSVHMNLGAGLGRLGANNTGCLASNTPT